MSACALGSVVIYALWQAGRQAGRHYVGKGYDDLSEICETCASA